MKLLLLAGVIILSLPILLVVLWTFVWLLDWIVGAVHK